MLTTTVDEVTGQVHLSARGGNVLIRLELEEVSKLRQQLLDAQAAGLATRGRFDRG